MDKAGKMLAVHYPRNCNWSRESYDNLYERADKTRIRKDCAGYQDCRSRRRSQSTNI